TVVIWSTTRVLSSISTHSTSCRGSPLPPGPPRWGPPGSRVLAGGRKVSMVGRKASVCSAEQPAASVRQRKTVRVRLERTQATGANAAPAATPCRSRATRTQRVRLSPRPPAKPHSKGALQSAAWPSVEIRHNTDTQSNSTPHSVMKPTTPNSTDSRGLHQRQRRQAQQEDDRQQGVAQRPAHRRRVAVQTKDGLKMRKRTRDVSDSRRSVSSSTDISSRLFSVVLATRKTREAATSGSSPAPRSAKMMSSAKYDSSQLMRWKPLVYSSRSRCTEAFQTVAVSMATRALGSEPWATWLRALSSCHQTRQDSAPRFMGDLAGQSKALRNSSKWGWVEGGFGGGCRGYRAVTIHRPSATLAASRALPPSSRKKPRSSRRCRSVTTVTSVASSRALSIHWPSSAKHGTELTTASAPDRETTYLTRSG
ncbi:hypothetical protein CRUP_035383, partial [Coryphaenoides rupestris]